MTDMIGTPIIILAVIILYIVCTTLITRYAISGGKSSKEIIESNKLKATKSKDFRNKYPEANIKTGRNFALAFGFIFAFASSIYAFSIMSDAQNTIVFTPLEIDSAAVIQIHPPINIEKVKVLPENVVPPPPPQPISNIITKEDLPEVDEPVLIDKPIDDEPRDILPPEKDDPTEIDPVVDIAEKMPRFKGCENMDEDEAYQCTMTKIQKYISNINYPTYAFDKGIEGKVYVSFVIDQKGNVIDVELLKGADKSLNKESLKHIKKMPSFASGGKQGGRKVKVKFRVPINFKLRN